MSTARIAAAPISWGVSEVPGWGFQISADAVLRDMRELGITATEFGPEGFLPDAPEAKAATLAGYGLRAVGGFLPVVLHDPGHDPLPEVDRFIDALLVAGGDSVVLAAATGADGYDERPTLDDAQRKHLLDELSRLGEHAAARGVTASIHPHVGTMVQTAAEIEQVLAESTIGLCIDTGHMMVGGADPVAIARTHGDRIVHAHLKDVDAALASEVLSGTRPFGDAVAAGMFRPLGKGDVPIAELVELMESAGYRGWYVLEQDLKLTHEPADDGPIADVRASLEYLTGLL